jgi:hypothetical protein
MPATDSETMGGSTADSAEPCRAVQCSTGGGSEDEADRCKKTASGISSIPARRVGLTATGAAQDQAAAAAEVEVGDVSSLIKKKKRGADWE